MHSVTALIYNTDTMLINYECHVVWSALEESLSEFIESLDGFRKETV